jgi:hypothetical protein
MRNAIFSILAIIGIALGITAAGSSAHAKYLYQPCDCNDGNGWPWLRPQLLNARTQPWVAHCSSY